MERWRRSFFLGGEFRELSKQKGGGDGVEYGMDGKERIEKWVFREGARRDGDGSDRVRE